MSKLPQFKSKLPSFPQSSTASGESIILCIKITIMLGPEEVKSCVSSITRMRLSLS